jgi:hypothetical protein
MSFLAVSICWEREIVEAESAESEEFASVSLLETPEKESAESLSPFVAELGSERGGLSIVVAIELRERERVLAPSCMFEIEEEMFDETCERDEAVCENELKDPSTLVSAVTVLSICWFAKF